MREYILVVDTETSGIPKDWKAPYHNGSWPYIVQIAWAIYTKNGEEIKVENHYIKAHDFTIDPQSVKIHGITEALLENVGKQRPEVFRILHQDILTFNPLIVGHFMEFDNHMLELGFQRAGLENAARDLPKFCTMKASKRYNIHPWGRRFLRLDELYSELFRKKLEKQHDALIDAKATGACFFEMIRRNDINEETIRRQQLSLTGSEPGKARYKWLVWMVFLIIIITLIWIAF